MDEKTSALMGELKDRLINASDGQITEIIREARDEALAEAKAIIKGMMVQAILEHALGELEGAENNVQRSTSDVQRSPEAQASTAESEEQIGQEIEAIRRKIAENERLLSQMTAVTSEASPGGLRTADDGGEGSEGSCGYYVYGIVAGDGSQPVEELPEEGIDPAHPVYALQPSAISHQPSAISAIVSKVSLQEFGQEELKANLNDIKWVEAKVRAHQRILETVLAGRTLIPMRFCTIYRSESGVQEEMLDQYYDDFVDALAHLEGKQEWGVKVFCDGEALAQRVGEVSDRVKKLKADMEQKSSGAAYFLRKKVDETVAEEVERISDEYAQRSHDRLSNHAEEAVINPLRSRELTGREEAMILNGAYLVAEEQLPAFRAELESLEEEHGHMGFSYEITGPWPPYNFVSTCTEPSRSIGLEEGAADE